MTRDREKPQRTRGTHSRIFSALAAVSAVIFLSAAGTQPPNAAPTQDLQHPQNTNVGILTFTGRCATCHDTAKDGATDRYALNRFTPEQVLASMTTGSMAQYAQGLSEFEKRVVAVYVGGRPLGSYEAGDAAKMRNRCEARRPFDRPARRCRRGKPRHGGTRQGCWRPHKQVRASHALPCKAARKNCRHPGYGSRYRRP